jgi:hypothetical protein
MRFYQADRLVICTTKRPAGRFCNASIHQLKQAGKPEKREQEDIRPPK